MTLPAGGRGDALDGLIERLSTCIARMAYSKRGADVSCISCGEVVHIPRGTARKFVHGVGCDVEAANGLLNELAALQQGSPALATPQQDRLRRIVMAWDTDDSLEFLAALTDARDSLGLKLADQDEERIDQEVLLANGYTATGSYLASSPALADAPAPQQEKPR